MNWPQHLLRELGEKMNEAVRKECPGVGSWANKEEKYRKRYDIGVKAILEEAQRRGLIVFVGPLRAAEEEAEKLQTPSPESADSEKEAMLNFFKGR
jgi:hypothetical protein